MFQVKTRPIAPYLGGKFKLAKRICTIIDADTHTTYAEPFIGMGGIFLRRSKRPKVEFINDYNQDVSNLFLILREHYQPFVDLLRFQITSQAEFNRLKAVDPKMLTDIQRAARFLFLQRLSFGGKVIGQHFGVCTERTSNFNVHALEPNLIALHKRLSGVIIMCENYDKFITRIDRKYTLFYLDPPYFNCEDDYGKLMFERDDFKRLAKQLATIKGKFLMSINDVPEVRKLFKAFKITKVKTSYSISRRTIGRGVRSELLISNFEWRLE